MMRANGKVDPDAARAEPLEQVIDMLARAKFTVEMDFVLSDVLTNLERASDRCSNLAAALVETAHDSFDMHEYIRAVEAGEDDHRQLDTCMKRCALENPAT